MPNIMRNVFTEKLNKMISRTKCTVLLFAKRTEAVQSLMSFFTKHMTSTKPFQAAVGWIASTCDSKSPKNTLKNLVNFLSFVVYLCVASQISVTVCTRDVTQNSSGGAAK